MGLGLLMNSQIVGAYLTKTSRNLYLPTHKKRTKSMALALVRLPPVLSRLHLPSGVRIQVSNPTTLRRAKLNPITARDRSKNRKPTQRGRYLSIEAIQAVQSMKRARINDPDSIGCVIETRVQRLVKRDMMAAMKELINQGEAILAFLVFEEVRKEHWYKPQLSVYVDLITVLADNGLREEVEQICSCLKKERLEPDTERFNLLLSTLLNFGFNHTAMDCFRLMKLWESEPDESTFRILINGLASNGEVDLSVAVRNEAEKYFDGHLEFLEEKVEMALSEV